MNIISSRKKKTMTTFVVVDKPDVKVEDKTPLAASRGIIKRLLHGKTISIGDSGEFTIARLTSSGKLGLSATFEWLVQTKKTVVPIETKDGSAFILLKKKRKPTEVERKKKEKEDKKKTQEDEKVSGSKKLKRPEPSKKPLPGFTPKKQKRSKGAKLQRAPPLRPITQPLPQPQASSTLESPLDIEEKRLDEILKVLKQNERVQQKQRETDRKQNTDVVGLNERFLDAKEEADDLKKELQTIRNESTVFDKETIRAIELLKQDNEKYQRQLEQKHLEFKNATNQALKKLNEEKLQNEEIIARANEEVKAFETKLNAERAEFNKQLDKERVENKADLEQATKIVENLQSTFQTLQDNQGYQIAELQLKINQLENQPVEEKEEFLNAIQQTHIEEYLRKRFENLTRWHDSLQESKKLQGGIDELIDKLSGVEKMDTTSAEQEARDEKLGQMKEEIAQLRQQVLDVKEERKVLKEMEQTADDLYFGEEWENAFSDVNKRFSFLKEVSSYLKTKSKVTNAVKVLQENKYIDRMTTTTEDMIHQLKEGLLKDIVDEEEYHIETPTKVSQQLSHALFGKEEDDIPEETVHAVDTDGNADNLLDVAKEEYKQEESAFSQKRPREETQTTPTTSKKRRLFGNITN